MIWHKDQILKNYSLEAMTIELNALKKQMIESEERRERESQTRNYPVISFRKPRDKKAEKAVAESDEPAKAGDPERA